MKTPLFVRELAIVLLLAGAAVNVRAASFSAELVDTRAGQVRTGPFNFQDKSYRFEVAAGDQTLVVACDGQTGATRILSSKEQAYHEAGPEEPFTLFANPFAAYAHYARTREVRAEGTEAVDGVPCTKQVVSSGEQVFVVAWWSEEFAFPLKVQTTLDGRTVEIRNIKRGPQDPALFAVPAGYKLTPLVTEEPPPEWAAQIPDAPVLTPPFEQTLAAGKIIRIRPLAGRPLSLKGTNPRAETCAFTAIGFKNGRPLGQPSMNTVNLDTDNEVTMTFSEDPAEADEIVVRVRNGTATIKAAFVGAPDAAPAESAPADEAASPEPPAALPPAAVTEVSAGLHAPRKAAMASLFEVLWSGPGNPDDFISVARPGQPPGGHLGSARVRDGNPVKLWAPSEPGDYEVRYVLARGAKVLAKAPITVRPVTAAVEATGPVKVAGWIEVPWEGPGGESDYISVARPGQAPGGSVNHAPVKLGNPARVRAPSDPGAYEVRYILGRGSKLLAKVPIAVEDVAATVQAPATAKAGADFEVRWTGPGYPEDFIALARVNQAPGARIAATPTRLGNPLKLRAPKEPGTYEVRYILGRGNRLLAKATITIEAP